MKIKVWSIGKAHESYVKEGIEMFTGRIKHYFPIEWKIIPASGKTLNMSIDAVQKLEGKALMEMLPKEDILIVLDEKGKFFNSEQLAQFIQKKANESTKNIVFLIGGAYGVSKMVIERAALKLSLSAFVFPHQLVRLIMIEQIYRACTIIRNEKYHHS